MPSIEIEEFEASLERINSLASAILKEIGELEQQKMPVLIVKFTKNNVHSIIDFLKKINEDIQKAQKELFSLTNDTSYLQDANKKEKVLYQANIIHQKTQQLISLTKQIKEALENNEIPESEVSTIENALFGRMYFKNQKNIPISISDWLEKVFLPKLRDMAEQSTPKAQKQAEPPPKKETSPKWLDELIALSMQKKGLRSKYLLSSAYRNTDSIDNRLTRLMQQRLGPSKTRIEQLKLMTDTLKLLEKSNFSLEEKIKIARGLMLVIKHQIEHEDNRFKTRMGVMVDEYINATDNSPETSRTLSANTCIAAFHTFSKNLTLTTKMEAIIDKASKDETWQNSKTQFYQLHQKINSIQQIITRISPKRHPSQTAVGFFENMHTNLNQGVERVDMPLKKSPVRGAKSIQGNVGAIETNVIYTSLEGLIEKSRNEIDDLAKELEQLKDAPQHLSIKLEKHAKKIADYDYLIKIAEERFEKLSDDSEKLWLENALAELEKSMKSLEERCKVADTNPRIETERKNTTPKKSARRFGFPSFEFSKKNKAVKETVKTAFLELRINIMKISDVIHEGPENLKPQQTEIALNFAKNRYNAMRKSSTENVSTKILIEQIKTLTNSEQEHSIPKNITALQQNLNNTERPLNPQNKEKIALSLRIIENQLKTLAYLAEIAELKLDPSANVIRRVSAKQAENLQNTISSISTQISDFEQLRKKALLNLGVDKPKTNI